jgi:hypothetical protein
MKKIIKCPMSDEKNDKKKLFVLVIIDGKCFKIVYVDSNQWNIYTS